MSNITQEQSERYVNAGGSICPICGSKDIEAVGGFDFGGGAVYQTIRCNTCNATWTDAYQLMAAEDCID